MEENSLAPPQNTISSTPSQKEEVGFLKCGKSFSVIRGGRCPPSGLSIRQATMAIFCCAHIRDKTGDTWYFCPFLNYKISWRILYCKQLFLNTSVEDQPSTNSSVFIIWTIIIIMGFSYQFGFFDPKPYQKGQSLAWLQFPAKKPLILTHTASWIRQCHTQNFLFAFAKQHYFLCTSLDYYLYTFVFNAKCYPIRFSLLPKAVSGGL